MKALSRQKSLLHLRSVLLSMGLVVLALPVAALGVLRLFETEILRQTESELLAQAALIVPAWRSAWIDEMRAGGTPVVAPLVPTALEDDPENRLDPLRAQLDLATEEILEPGPEAAWTPYLPEATAARAGERITGLVREGVRRTLAGVRVVDSRGIVVASSSGELGLSLLGRKEIERALAGEAVSLLRRRFSDQPTPEYGSVSRRTGIRVFVAQPVKLGPRIIGAVLLSRTPVSVLDVLWRSRQNLLLSTLILVLVVAFVAFLAATWVNRPIQEIIKQAEVVAAGGRFKALEAPRLIEVHRLSEAIGSMESALNARAAYIRDFASHVSHEFKTPLTTIMGSLELLRDNLGKLTLAEQARLIQLVEGDAARLRSLVQRLLDLARADMTVADLAAKADLDALIRDAQMHFPDLKVDVSPELQRGLFVAMDAQSLRSVLWNLLENAFRHGAPPVTLVVRSDAVSRDFLAIEIRDQGAAISATNLSKIFEPFFTTARDVGGTGLGLAIVKTLVTAHRGDVSVLSRSGVGTSFTVKLPRRDLAGPDPAPADA